MTTYMNFKFSCDRSGVNREFYIVFNASQTDVQSALNEHEERVKANKLHKFQLEYFD